MNQLVPLARTTVLPRASGIAAIAGVTLGKRFLSACTARYQDNQTPRPSSTDAPLPTSTPTPTPAYTQSRLLPRSPPVHKACTCPHEYWSEPAAMYQIRKGIEEAKRRQAEERDLFLVRDEVEKLIERSKQRNSTNKTGEDSNDSKEENADDHKDGKKPPKTAADEILSMIHCVVLGSFLGFLIVRFDNPVTIYLRDVFTWILRGKDQKDEVV